MKYTFSGEGKGEKIGIIITAVAELLKDVPQEAEVNITVNTELDKK